MKRILLATRNIEKLNELRCLLGDIPFAPISLDDAKIEDEIDETGITFAENARLKAAGYSRLSGLMAVADDSGLEVDALDGAPGVHSARFAGPSADYDTKIAALLYAMKMSRKATRAARFVSHIAFSDRSGRIVFEAEGICDGMIADLPRGSNGFGYDPIFVPRGYDLTFGELDDDVKRSIGHRGRAISKIIRYLRDFA